MNCLIIIKIFHVDTFSIIMHAFSKKDTYIIIDQGAYYFLSFLISG